ncbi:MAG: capsule biosynthesis protein [Gemmatimonadetes bacterium]|nr:capsule biosynthesis protein [Gemmatimonadota bacterium]
MSILDRFLKDLMRVSVSARRLREWQLNRQNRELEPDWGKVLSAAGGDWRAARQAAQDGPRVLFATSTGRHASAPLLDSLLGAALTLRGASVHFLLCDRILPACQMAEYGLQRPREFAAGGPQAYPCHDCFERGAGIYRPLGLPIHRYSDLLTAEERTRAERLGQDSARGDLPSLTVEGIPIGEHALAGALRYFARATLDGEPEAEAILRRFVRAAVLTMYATRRLLRDQKIDVVCVHHAIYVPHGIVAEVARQEHCRVVAWNVAYRKRSFMFSHGETYHHTLMSEPTTDWEQMAWSDQHEREILDYLKSRRRGGRDWIVFHNTNPVENLRADVPELAGLDLDKPVIGLLTNVAWDAQLHYPANAFTDMLDWIITTVKYFAERPDLQLLIRVHPAEISGDIPSRQLVVEELKQAFGRLPPNVFVIPPQSAASTYAAMEVCDAVLIYGTKTGVELTSLGIPVIVAGEAWIRNKGLTLDATTKAEYLSLLDRLPLRERMSPEAVARARKYAYHFFFRRMIPLEQVSPASRGRGFSINIRSVTELAPGRSPGLDVICDGILHQRPFVYSAETDGPRE